LDLGIHWTEYREEAQVLVSGVLALIMGVGNLHSIIATLTSKARHAHDARPHPPAISSSSSLDAKKAN
jgi:hypothetical protein